MKDRNNFRNSGSSSSSASASSFPLSRHKDHHLYAEGEITHTGGGVYKVALSSVWDDNKSSFVELPVQMVSICTASKLDHNRVSLLLGDLVTVEIPTLALNPTEKVKGRIVWRQRSLSSAKSHRKA